MDSSDQYSDKERCLQAANSDVLQTQQQDQQIPSNIPDLHLPTLSTQPAQLQPQPAAYQLHPVPTVGRPAFLRAYPQQPQMFLQLPHAQGVSQHQLQQYQLHLRRQRKQADQSAQQLRLAATGVASLRKRVALAEDHISGAAQITPQSNAMPSHTYNFQLFAQIPSIMQSSVNSTHKSSANKVLHCQPTTYYVSNGHAISAAATANNGRPPDAAALSVQLDRAQQEVYRLKVQIESMKRSAVNSHDACKKAHREQINALKKDAADLLKRGKEALMKEIEFKNEALANLSKTKDVLQNDMILLKEAQSELTLEMERRQTEIMSMEKDAIKKENEVVNGWANLEILLRTKEDELEEMRKINETLVQDNEALQMEIDGLKEQAREMDAAVAKDNVVQAETLRRMDKELKKSRETIESLKREAQTKASDLVTEKVKLRENLTRREQEWKKMIEPFLRESDEEEMEEEL